VAKKVLKSTDFDIGVEDPDELSVDDLVTEERVTEAWHVEGVIPRGVCLFAGIPGSAKSAFAQYVAWCTTHGTKCLGLPTRHGPVIYLNYDHPKTLHELWEDKFNAGYGITGPTHLPLVFHEEELGRLDLTQKGDQQKVLKHIKDTKCCLMFFDRVVKFLFKEDRTQDMMLLMDFFRRCSTEMGNGTIIPIHEFNKSERPPLDFKSMDEAFYFRLRGSGEVLYGSDAALEMRSLKTGNHIITGPDGKSSTLKVLEEFGVYPHNKRYGVTVPFVVRLEDDPDGLGVRFQYKGEWVIRTDVHKAAEMMLKIVERYPDKTYNNRSAEKILGFHFSRETIAQMVNLMEEDEQIEWREVDGEYCWGPKGGDMLEELSLGTKSLDERFVVAVKELRQRYISEEKLEATVKKDFVDVLVPDFSFLAGSTKGPSGRVKKALEKFGDAVIRKSGALIVYFNLES